MVDTPYGDCFAVLTKWVFEPLPAAVAASSAAATATAAAAAAAAAAAIPTYATGTTQPHAITWAMSRWLHSISGQL